jgi:hypothetical protein
MAFSIDEIKGAMRFGGARPTLFQVILTMPPGIVGDLSTLQFMARATQIPASNLGLIQIPYFGRKVKIAGDRTYDPWTITVMNDEDFRVRNALEVWNQRINTHIGNLRDGNLPEERLYKSVGTVTQFGKQGNTLRTYNLAGVFPETVSTIDLDWNANDQIEEFQVQFQYDYFVVSGPTTTGVIA